MPILGIILLLAASCSSARRYEILTFFFDGVPPPGTKKEEIEEARRQREAERFMGDQHEPQTAGRWFAHEPIKDCSTCHKRRGESHWAVPQFVKEVPQLCYDCHTGYTRKAAIVHGPVAVGECLFCHDPHRSKYEHLVVEPEPELCYLCHDRGMIASISGHSAEAASDCSKCHEAHGSSAEGLLKPGGTVNDL